MGNWVARGWSLIPIQEKHVTSWSIDFRRALWPPMKHQSPCTYCILQKPSTWGQNNRSSSVHFPLWLPFWKNRIITGRSYVLVAHALRGQWTAWHSNSPELELYSEWVGLAGTATMTAITFISSFVLDIVSQFFYWLRIKPCFDLSIFFLHLHTDTYRNNHSHYS
jgi:hypothetical protein